MKIQKSFRNQKTSGTLYVVPTPIGNLEDMTFRAVATLKEVDGVAAEDTRNTKKLMNHFDIDTHLISYHEHNKQTRGKQLVERIEKGELIAVVSDAGMPAISDPGADLVQETIAADLPVVVLPGANAALPALAGSGMSTDQFYFYGFLPRKKKDRLDELQRLASLSSTLIFYESPHRLKEMLTHVHQQLGNRQAALARELTKRYEEYIRGTLEELVSWSNEEEVRGEFCVVVEGGEDEEQGDPYWWTPFSVTEHVDYYMETEGLKSKDAIKQTSVDRKMSKRGVYQVYHVDEES